MKKWKIFVLLVLAVLVFIAGYTIRGRDSSKKEIQTSTTTKQQWWTCSMHPQIRQPKPGKCPICGMDLVPVNDESGPDQIGQRQISFSPEAVKLMEIQTNPVERKFVEAQIRMVGKIDYDETRVKHITAWVPGRIDRLYVDFTGTRVLKGDHMVYLYSPELVSAQAELIQALKAKQRIKAKTSDLIKRTTEETLESAGEKLRLLGLTDRQIKQVEKTGQPTDRITITAPMGGIVIDKHVSEGMYVNTGTQFYTIADLSHLWVKLDAYESDMTWLRYGQQVEFTTEACPGQTFKGTISFVSPTLDPKTRTIKLRVNVINPDEKLKPEMFVHAVVKSKLAQGGLVMDPDMAGKWICPMHPSVIKDTKGKCDICGMDLATTESLGYVKAELPAQPPLVIPVSAPLITGKRAVVYVQLPDPDRPVFEGREIILGPRAGDYYLVEQGLDEGDRVVTKGNFKIDSALQIQAQPSMMNPEGQTSKPMSSGHHH